MKQEAALLPPSQVVITPTGIFLTDEGRLFADSLAAALFVLPANQVF